MSYFLSLLQKKDYSEAELKGKAYVKGYNKDEVENCIEQLRNKNFVNDDRLAENIISSYGCKKGRLWLKQKLSLRGISGPKIEENLTRAYQEGEPDLTLKIKIQRKYNVVDWSKIDPVTKQKIARYLQGQGFTNPFEILKCWSELD